jgi:hypothetical protein
MDALDGFGEQLVAAAARRRGYRYRPAHGLARRGVRAALIAGALLLVAAAVAAAAGVFATGTPVRPPSGMRLSPTDAYGTPLPGSVSLLAVSVPDPAGGPPWGLRYQRTTRGYGCLQVARLLDGRLGVLGEDGAFGDDGRFHPLPPGIFGPFACSVIEPIVGARMAVGLAATASGLPPMPCGRRGRPCPGYGTGDQRVLYYGLLGPQATSVTYRDPHGALHTIPTVGPDGAYLVVEAPPREPQAMRTGAEGSPVPPIVAVTYHGGRTCHIGPMGGCPPRRQAGSTVRLPPEARVRSPLSVHLAGPGNHTIEASFRARVPVHSAQTVYGIAVTTLASSGPGCNGRGVTGATMIERDVSVSEMVHLSYQLGQSCPSETVRVRILLAGGLARGAGPAGRMPLLHEDGAGATRLVGQATLTVHGGR